MRDEGTRMERKRESRVVEDSRTRGIGKFSNAGYPELSIGSSSIIAVEEARSKGGFERRRSD
jgi:hypothetical protein